MQAINNPICDPLLGCEGFINADPVIWESDFKDEPLFDGATNSKYIEFAGRRFELRTFGYSSIYYFDYHYQMPDGLPLYLAITFDVDSGEYSITSLNSHNFISVLDKTGGELYQLDRGERVTLQEGNTLYIGTDRFIVTTQRSIQDPTLKALKLLSLP